MISYTGTEFRIMKPYPGTQAVLRAVSLLKAFSPERPERGLTELTQAVGLNKTTAYRLLSALESEGLVERARGGEGYRLGPELLALGSRALRAGELRAASRPELLALAQETRETATLEVRIGRDVLILDEALGPHVLGSAPSIGTRWPAHATSTGKVLLAHLGDAQLEEWLKGPLAAPTPKAIDDPAALRRELSRVRERGVAVSLEELEPGFVAVGAPVRSAHGDVVAAISVGGPKGRLGAERLAVLARDVPAAAARVSRRLGFGDATTPAPGGPAPSRKGRR
jgi:DNA-binding IclR family transcriptional regulator